MYLLLPLLLLASTFSETLAAPNASSDLDAEKQFQELFSLANHNMSILFWKDVLEPALLANSLSIIAASVIDTSLENEHTTGTIKLLKTPRSFRASVYQTVQLISEAFRTADQSMSALNINLNDVPQMIKTMIRAYAKPADKGSKFLMKLQMKTFVKILKACINESTTVSHEFNNALKLVRELAEATAATVGENKEIVKKAQKRLEHLEELKLSREKELQRLEEEMGQHRKAQDNAGNEQRKAVNNVVTNSEITSLGVVLNVANLINAFRFGGAATTAPNPGSEDVERANRKYFEESSILSDLEKKELAHRESIADIEAMKMRLNTDLLDSDALVSYLPEGVSVLNKIVGEWSQLKALFETLYSQVVVPIQVKLETVDVETETAFHAKRKQLVMEALKAAASCVSIAKEAKLYDTLSKKFILPLIEASTSKLVLNKQKAKAAFTQLEERTKRTNNEAKEFIEEKTRELNEKATDQLKQYRDQFNAALST